MRGSGDLRRTLRLFARFTAGQRRVFLYATLLLALEAVTAVAVPDLISKLTDFLVDDEEPSWFGFTAPTDAAVYVIAAGIVVATAVNSSSSSLAEIHLANAGRTLGFNLRGTLFAHLQRLPLAFHLQRSTGDVLTRLTGDVKAMEDFVEDSVGDIVGSVLVLSATLYYLFGQSWEIGLLALVIVPLLTLVSNLFARRIKAASKQQRASEGELASTAQEMLSAISLVQVYGRGETEQRKFARQSGVARDAILRTARLEAVFGFTVAFIESVGIAIVILVGAGLVADDSLTAGELVAFILLIQNMFKPIRRIIKQWNRVAGVYASVERVNELLDLRPTVFDSPDARPAPPLRGQLAFRDVSFAYQSPSDGPDGSTGRLALQGVHFQVVEGESVALVGHSGAGKSTIAQLVPRLYDPHVGAVLIDGHDIRQFTLDSLRAQISMVLQETLLLRGTVAENIAYGREGATREEVVGAAQRANAHDFITALPDGYDTVLGERAATLSGGQRQRLSIARAFIRDTPILILDEPTTGLDAASAALVAESLQLLSRNRTTLIVSHDLNLIRGVDRVLVISAGRVFEEGSPEDLLASGGLYAELYAHQFGEATAAAVAGSAGDGTGELVAAERAAALSEAEEEVSGAERVDVRRFDTVLAEAVPRPATREQFLAATGWPSTVGVPVPGEVDLDPLRSPRLTRALPGLAEALSGPAMAARLQRVLADDWELLTCSPGKPFVEPGQGATLRYRLDVRRRGTAETVEHLVAGRLFPTVEAAEEWRAQLDPLAGRLAGRGDLSAFTCPTLLVRELRLVLHAFPVDPALPGLGPATDPAQLVARLGPLLESSVPGLRLEGVHADVVRYRRHACVLRYELAWHLRPSGRSLKQVVYGTVYADGRGHLVGPAVTALRDRLEGAPSPLRFQVPRFQGYLPDLRIALLEAMPGSPLLPSVLHAPSGVAGEPAFRGPTPEEAVVACARVAAGLHRSSIPVGPPRPLAEEIDGVRAAVDDLAPLAPAMAASLHRHLAGIADLARDAPGRPAVAHGDLRPSRVLFDGATTGLTSFDAVCLAEPALDLGEFTGRLAVALRTTPGGAGPTGDDGRELESAFLREYTRLDDDTEPDALVARVAAYRTVSLARLAVRSWCQLKPQRLRPVMALLRDPPRIRSGVP
ncbi:ABC transporter ATP-binding protein [Geodermatophilus sabuli]|uniref:ABC-type multidrug transport system, ATPase and permease component n=1 Tax=Geodermatophilus sabuli TaxID=1564158 RepID=A0A285EEJ5_9ACTN|nr:ABC transporter ATP-binding protein [Geodermatophilus sabuli]MBB3086235.1 ABC-type multidrug transport system fused ATPase/permease subunit [Geodermatophilus sabuli]SNX97548.1 ABC-type multidrug transport system, ATPase and permease component [Geodermatophilus sabuli]